MGKGEHASTLPPTPRRWLRTDKSGAVAVYVALVSAVTFGVVGLAIDATRAMIVQSEAQAAADAAALAGASQLDGTPTAITRANAAVANLVANNQRLASTGAGAVAMAQVRFLANLPASDNSPITAANVTTDPLLARFVEVTTAPLSHQNTFLRAVGAGAGMNIAASAVGGAHQVVCGASPMMMCNPAEATTIGAPFDISQWRGRQVRLLFQADSWAPGNFGYLSSGSNGANALRDALASTAGANICYGPSATTEPGQTNGARAALNVRFDMYQNPGFQGQGNNPLFAPDVNVRRGSVWPVKGNGQPNCNGTPQVVNAAAKMPLDSNLVADPNARFGNGHWNCLSYWNANFSSSGVARPVACIADTVGFTRYDMYNYEIAHNLPAVQGPGGETGEAVCRGPANPPQASRRIIVIAIINCREQNLHGRQTTPVVTFVRVFLTEPVSEPSSVQIIGEILDVVQPSTDTTVLHEVVQLYR